MRVSFLAPTLGACLLVAGTTFAEPPHPRAVDVELCHDFAHGVSLYSGSGSLQGGTTFADLVEAAGCSNAGSECVIQYCYGGSDSRAAAAVTRGEKVSER